MVPPLYLFCDTDCLIQLFLINQSSLLKWYKTRYDLEAVIVPEVENELAWHAKFRDRFDSNLRKAVASGLITVFDYSRPEQVSPFFPGLQMATGAAQAITKTGNDYNLIVGAGEAYSHAACIHLGMPLLSHDRSAITTLLKNNLQTAAPVLRVFDLVALAYRQGALSTKACDSIRQILDQSSEFLPQPFQKTSFERGLSQFDARVDEDPTGSGRPASCQDYRDRYFLFPV